MNNIHSCHFDWSSPRRTEGKISTVNKKGDFSVAPLLRNDIFVHSYLSEGATPLKVASAKGIPSEEMTTRYFLRFDTLFENKFGTI